LKNTKKTIVRGSGSSFRAAGNESTSVQLGVFAYLDNLLATQISSHKESVFTHFGSAGTYYASICMVDNTGEYYGGIAFSYEGIVVKFTRKQDIYTIDIISPI
jgi:hypothetical protein